jgi:predicted O-methyltransferase YrrM
MNLDINDALNTLMFDFHSYYDRIAAELPSGCRIAEIGVADAHSALYLAKKLKEHNKAFTLYMIDSLDYGGTFQLCTIYENIIKSGLGEHIKVIPKDSLEAAKDFNDGYFHMVFIDSSHTYEGTKLEIPAWYEKVVDGGILAGHDFIGHPEVYKAVTETIPLFVTRNDIPDRVFDAERFLLDEVKTDRGYGIWECRKDFYKKLNP